MNMEGKWNEVIEIRHEGVLVATVTGTHLHVIENSAEDVDVAWYADLEVEK